MQYLLIGLLTTVNFLANSAAAQQSFIFKLPHAQITADKLVRGDGDTYGLGDWNCSFTVALDGNKLNVQGKISFTEKANDFTTIVGEYHQSIIVGKLERCRHCIITLDETQGTVSGTNIGARGYRWFVGQGLVRRACIQTDTFGDDVGSIGGTVQFVPIRVLVDCSIAKVD
ncbi:MAG: hypothetical protein ACKVT2_09515 [Saprospiraceae bacterium]